MSFPQLVIHNLQFNILCFQKLSLFINRLQKQF
jgi:hypothetical protein